MWPDAPALRDFLARAWRQLALRAAIDGATAGILLALIAVIGAWVGAWPPAATITIAALAFVAPVAGFVWRALTRRSATALDVERRAPGCRNLIVTAAELLERPHDIRSDIGAMVCQHAVAAAQRLEIRALFPLGSALRRLGLAAGICAATVTVVAGRPAPVVTLGDSSGGTISLDRVEVVIIPPDYARQPTRTMRDPAEVSALAGSRLQIQVQAHASLVTLETLDARVPLTRAPDGSFSGALLAEKDGFVALQTESTEGRSPVRRLIGLNVIPDRGPVVRIVKPGRDLFVETAATLPIEITAEDDLGLASLRLRYTTVTGSEEQFEFTEGEVPLRVARESDRRWTATVTWPLQSLTLAPGNMVVYRAVATDGRPGAPAVESDAFIVQIVTPDRAALEGFLLDDDPNRYAISQQMVILKTERLLARRGTLSAETFADEALTIAAEQRRVRAEFIFMMGGEMADLNVTADVLDETEEAERESELAEGRLQNQGRLDLIRATRQMSRAASLLAQPDATEALVAERAALVALQRAFARGRYLLRTLSTQQQLDLSRRLGGRFTNLAADTRPTAAPIEDARTVALRRILADVSALAGAAALTRPEAARASDLAEGLLRLDAPSEAIRPIAAALAEAANAIERGDTATARPGLERSALALSAVIRDAVLDAPIVPSGDASRLGGALVDALRRGRGPR